jgi:hypothetical protein
MVMRKVLLVVLIALLSTSDFAGETSAHTKPQASMGDTGKICVLPLGVTGASSHGLTLIP